MTQHAADTAAHPFTASRSVIRLVQIETFYPPYLEHFYATNPHLRTASFAEQTEALLRGRFSAAHNVAPYLRELGYETHFIIANCLPTQQAWMREHGLPLPPHEAMLRDVTRMQIDRLEPDVLYLSDSLTLDSRWIRTLSRRPPLVMAWHAAPVPATADWSEYDVLLSGLAAMRELALRKGVKAAELYMPGFPEEIVGEIGDVREEHDVVFAGSFVPGQHTKRNELLEGIGGMAINSGFNCAFHLTSATENLPPAIARWRRDSVFGLEMQKALRTGKIVFDSRSSMAGVGPDGLTYDVAGRETANMRVFETTGSGAFLLTERHDNLTRYFEPGREIETFSGIGELQEKIRHYLDHPDERRAIAERGQRRCLTDHSMSRRIHDFDAIVRRHLPTASVVAAPIQITPTVEPKVRHFCTYFDSAYAPRGMVMIASILRFLPNARIHALCLDDVAHRMVSERQPSVIPIRLADLESFDSELTACKGSRKKIEYYFTLTPCLPRYVMSMDQNIDMVTYLDADLFFYTSPELVFEDIGDASIAISPHRFTPHCAGHVKYGVYNVAWVTWRNDDEGRRCLEDYRKDCIDWCFDILDGDRFADQKYLDKWPATYRGVHALTGKGMNLALWNLDNYTLEQKDSAIRVDADPLIFYHFHGVSRVSIGHWDIRINWYDVEKNKDFIISNVYKPYLFLIESVFNRLQPAYGLSIDGNIRYDDSTVQAVPQAILQPSSTGYAVFSEQPAPLPTGEAWHQEEVTARQDAAYAYLLQEMRQGRARVDLVVAATAVQATGLSTPSLLEVGCGSGYYSEVFDFLLKGAVTYTGLDFSQTMIAQACQRYPQHRFQMGDATSMPFEDGSFDIVLNGAALMHIPDYAAAIREARRVSRRFCVFHTLPLLLQRQTTFLRKNAYGHPVTEVILNHDEFLACLHDAGLIVRRIWESIPYDLEALLGEPTVSRTFLCETV